jgi:predicted RNase H-like HicB family nuclease
LSPPLTILVRSEEGLETYATLWCSGERKLVHMTRKASVVIEKDEDGFYAWCPELKGCQSQGNTLEETIANIKEAIELYLETLPADERDVLLSREILTTAVEVNA